MLKRPCGANQGKATSAKVQGAADKGKDKGTKGKGSSVVLKRPANAAASASSSTTTQTNNDGGDPAVEGTELVAYDQPDEKYKRAVFKR